MDQENDLLQLSEDLKILDDESPIPQKPIPYEDIGEPVSASDSVIDTTPDEPEYYEQLLKEPPVFPDPRTENGGSYVPGRSYAANGYSAPHGANPSYRTAMLPMPMVKKNRKPIVSLIFGIGAMGVLNFFPFIALILGLIALCTGYFGLKKGELTTGKRVCGLIGLALGIISLILSVSMLVILLSLSFKVSKMGLHAQGSLFW